MITSNIKTLLAVVVVLFINPRSYAGDWGAGNAGDTCEKRIGEIRDDIVSWINKGAAKKLKLPANITPEEYKTEMLRVMDKDYAIISCPDEKIEFENVEKTCVNYYNNEVGSHFLECDFSRFNKTDESKQYELIHHEYAGLAGFETNDGDVASDYTITNQISGYLVDVVVKKLSINPPEKKEFQYELFGMYPSKFHCYYLDGEIVKCKQPTLFEIDKLIQNYVSNIKVRTLAFQSFKNQNEEFKKQLLQIADEKESEIGENQFSKLYRDYVVEMDSMLEIEIMRKVSRYLHYVNEERGTKVYDYIERMISNESPYIKRLIKLRELIKEGATDRDFFTEIFDESFQNLMRANKKMLNLFEEKLSITLSFRYSIKEYLQIDSSCSSLSGFGGGEIHRIHIDLVIDSREKYGFNLLKEREFLDKLLTSNSGKPVIFLCERRRRNTGRELMKISFDHERSALVIPFYVLWGIGAGEYGIGFEFKKGLYYYFGKEHMLKTLRENLKVSQ